MKHHDECFLRSEGGECNAEEDRAELAEECEVDIWFGLGCKRRKVGCIRSEFGRRYWVDRDLCNEISEHGDDRTAYQQEMYFVCTSQGKRKVNGTGRSKPPIQASGLHVHCVIPKS